TQARTIYLSPRFTAESTVKAIRSDRGSDQSEFCREELCGPNSKPLLKHRLLRAHRTRLSPLRLLLLVQQFRRPARLLDSVPACRSEERSPVLKIYKSTVSWRGRSC